MASSPSTPCRSAVSNRLWSCLEGIIRPKFIRGNCFVSLTIAIVISMTRWRYLIGLAWFFAVQARALREFKWCPPNQTPSRDDKLGEGCGRWDNPNSGSWNVEMTLFTGRMKDDGTRAHWHPFEFVIDEMEQTIISSSLHGELLVRDIANQKSLFYLPEVSMP